MFDKIWNVRPGCTYQIRSTTLCTPWMCCAGWPWRWKRLRWEFCHQKPKDWMLLGLWPSKFESSSSRMTRTHWWDGGNNFSYPLGRRKVSWLTPSSSPCWWLLWVTCLGESWNIPGIGLSTTGEGPSHCPVMIIEDVGHLGFNNQFLVATSHELAVIYNDKSPLENMHCGWVEDGWGDDVGKARWVVIFVHLFGSKALKSGPPWFWGSVAIESARCLGVMHFNPGK